MAGDPSRTVSLAASPGGEVHRTLPPFRHLFAADPLQNPAFIDLLLRFPIDRLEKDLPAAPAQENDWIDRVSVLI
jgi:hypothetical protein